VALRDAVARTGAELHRADEAIRALEHREAELCDELAALGPRVADAEEQQVAAAAAWEEGEEALARARAKVEELRSELGTARQDQRVWTARAEALGSFLHSGGADADRLGEVEGSLGPLLDLVDVDQGWERAFEAAVGQAAAAIVLDGLDSARPALARAREGQVGATMLAVTTGPAAGSATQAGGLRDHVRSTIEGMAGLLDSILGRAVVVDRWEDGLDLVLADPDIVAVTLEGDRFSADGWRVGPSTVPTRAGLEEARWRAEEAGAVAAAAEHRLRTALAEAGAAEASQSDLGDRRQVLAAGLDERAEALRGLEEERRTVITKRRAVEAHVQRENQRVLAESGRVAELETLLPALEADEEVRAERARALQSARRRLDERVAAVSTLRTDLEVRASALQERRSMLSARLVDVDERLLTLAGQREAAEGRRHHLRTVATVTSRLAAVVEDRISLLEERLAVLHEQRRQRQAAARAAREHLDGLRRRRAASSGELEATRDRRRQAELEEAGLRLRLDAVTEAVRRELDCELDEIVASPCPELPPETGAEVRLERVDEELRNLGPVNALALEDHQALEERHSFVEGQLADVRSARRELGKVVRAIDGEITDVFAAAFADVAENFAKLFIALFPGGTGQLRLTDPEDLLTTGIEVEARPSGKRVGKLSLLSGGERSLTALAFLFAVFRSRPSPFYLLDEVEAALDDVNLNRFLELVDEFRNEAQLVVVSHQKRTMEAADCLYGVTMQPGGASMVVSERADRVGVASR